MTLLFCKSTKITETGLFEGNIRCSAWDFEVDMAAGNVGRDFSIWGWRLRA